MYEKQVLPIGVHNPDLLMVNVPATYEQGVIPDDEEPPMGYGRIAAVMEAHQRAPAILDAHRLKLQPQEIRQIIERVDPKLVGLNPTSVNVPEAMVIADICRDLDVPFVLGGVLPTLDPYHALTTFPDAIAVVRGKGEHATMHLTNGFNPRETGAEGIYTRQDLKQPQRVDFAKTYPIAHIPHIDHERFFIQPAHVRHEVIDGQMRELREIALFESSGCPYACGYCATPALVGRGMGLKPYEHPPVEKVIDSVRQTRKLGANAAHFLDDMIFTSPQQLRELTEGFENITREEQREGKEGDLFWRGMTRVNIVEKCSNDDLEKLAESGCWRMSLGVESGNNEILRFINKGIRIEQVYQQVARLRNAGVEQIKGFFIMGFPGESLQQIEDTRRSIMFLKDVGLTHISLFQFKPYPGTALWKHLEATNPQALQQLSYLRVTSDNSDIVVGKKQSEGVWLPDDLSIAQVPSGYVRGTILETIHDFYGN